MIKQVFDVGNDAWNVTCFYDPVTKEDFIEVSDEIMTLGSEDPMDDLMHLFDTMDNGYTISNTDERRSIVVIGHSSSAEQMYDTIQHELKHLVEHISEYYDVDSKSERAAYLQGEIARNMFVASAMCVCPRCTNGYYIRR